MASSSVLGNADELTSLVIQKFITEEVQASRAFRKSRKNISDAVRKAARLLGKHSIPFWSPRYQGHMYVQVKKCPVLSLRPESVESFCQLRLMFIKVYGCVYACSFGLFHDNAL